MLVKQDLCFLQVILMVFLVVNLTPGNCWMTLLMKLHTPLSLYPFYKHSKNSLYGCPFTCKAMLPV